MAGDAGRDVEAVDVGELHVQQHELRACSRQVSSTALAPSTASPMTLNPSDLEQHASARPKGRVVVDDKDGAVHGFDSRHRANPFTYGWPYNTCMRAFYRLIAVVMALTAAAGSSAPNTAVPATNTVAPAAAQRRGRLGVDPAVDLEGRRPAPISARRRCELARANVRGSAWPPQPGLTVMQSTMSASSSATASAGVPGLSASAASGSPRR